MEPRVPENFSSNPNAERKESPGQFTYFELTNTQEPEELTPEKRRAFHLDQQIFAGMNVIKHISHQRQSEFSATGPSEDHAQSFFPFLSEVNDIHHRIQLVKNVKNYEQTKRPDLELMFILNKAKSFLPLDIRDELANRFVVSNTRKEREAVLDEIVDIMMMPVSRRADSLKNDPTAVKLAINTTTDTDIDRKETFFIHEVGNPLTATLPHQKNYENNGTLKDHQYSVLFKEDVHLQKLLSSIDNYFLTEFPSSPFTPADIIKIFGEECKSAAFAVSINGVPVDEMFNSEQFQISNGTVLWNETVISGLLRNLFQNARKAFMDKQQQLQAGEVFSPQISFTFEEKESPPDINGNKARKIEIIYADNGPGYPPEIADNYTFTKGFSKWDSSNPEQGTGFGMAEYSEIIKFNYDGTIWPMNAVNEQGDIKGAELHIILPVNA